MTKVLGVTHARVNFDVLRQACDCHVHVFGPDVRYPFWPGRAYTPGQASIEELTALHRALGIERVVIVHPSPYGADNAVTVDALRVIGGQARGVAVIDEATSDAALREMHAAGVRGVRVNLESAGETDPAVAKQRLEWAAARVKPLGWHVQTFARLPVIAALHETIAALPVTLVIDHFGRPDAALGPDQPGLDKIYALLKSGKVYVKISGAYRISQVPDFVDAAPIARAMIAANPDRIVWGSDWPHPGGGKGRATRDLTTREPFLPIDDGASLNRLNGWCENRSELEKILVENPARLYDF
ncbi:MAG TPA: amidohydrolase family protein [Pseudolabrys sp.]|nr:amidohydrolase family protein [Pseudolabrys sp.]